MEPTSESSKYAIVDTTYAYVGFKDGYVIYNSTEISVYDGTGNKGGLAFI
jgi:hypothetical protein